MSSRVAKLLSLTAGIFISTASFSVTQHDNELIFKANPGSLQTFRFVESGHDITKKQPYGGVTSEVQNQNSQGRIVVKAGRKGSPSVADWFRNQITGGAAVVCDSAGPSPDKLNFAVKGDLELTHEGKHITCKDFTLGQGHAKVMNNWWMGSSAMKVERVSLLNVGVATCKTDDGKTMLIRFEPELPCTHTFTLKFGVLGTTDEKK